LNLKNIELVNLKELFLKNTPLIDVRAPIEFEKGALPNAVNLPLLSNIERAQVGTLYKEQGNEAAVKLGHQLISGKIKEERINQWLNFIEKNPTTVLYCFRGGLRSQITQQWLKEAGVHRPIIVGGYKNSRQFLMDEIFNFAKNQDLISLCGPTGSGKTQFLAEVRSFYPSIDLEAIAKHRGSAFGSFADPQPSQIDFENQLAHVFIGLYQNINSRPPALIEDESRLIGRCILPDSLFVRLQQSPVIWIDEPLNQRVENIFQEYILNSPIGTLNEDLALLQFAKYKKSLHSISKKLGGLRTQEVLSLLENAENDFRQARELKLNCQWIEKLLVYYYDPLYLKSIEKRQVKVIFKGSKSECLAYLKNGGNYATS
jgi:tRNA 2-selenouridine synthase